MQSPEELTNGYGAGAGGEIGLYHGVVVVIGGVNRSCKSSVHMKQVVDSQSENSSAPLIVHGPGCLSVMTQH